MLIDGFPERLRQQREDHSLSMRELARQANVSQPSIGSYERGDSYPDLQTLERLADALQTGPAWLAFGVESTAQVRAEAARLKKARALLAKALQQLDEI